MPSLKNFPNGTVVRHDAYIHTTKISTLYGTITDGFIVTNGLGKSTIRFKQPIKFIKAHKVAKIKSNRYHSVNGNPWKIVEYLDIRDNLWRKLSEFKSVFVHSPSLAPPTIVSTLSKSEEYDGDDCQSFVSCISDLDEDESNYNTPFKLTYEQVDTIQVWQWKFWASNQFLQSWNQLFIEYLQDEANLNEIEAEMDYEVFSIAYPWITHYNLPHEEELWIGLRETLPFGEVWMDGWGNCWEVVEDNNYLATPGKWIGRWSRESNMLDLEEKEPGPLVSSDEFWDIIQDFDECV